MTDLPDWAKDRAREWMELNDESRSPEAATFSLACLLVEVSQREWDLGHLAATNAMSGHKPDCGGVDLRENRCECGWLESRAGTEDTARRETLAEVRRVVSECSLISEEARRALLGGIEHV